MHRWEQIAQIETAWCVIPEFFALGYPKQAKNVRDPNNKVLIYGRAKQFSKFQSACSFGGQ